MDQNVRNRLPWEFEDVTKLELKHLTWKENTPSVLERLSLSSVLIPSTDHFVLSITDKELSESFGLGEIIGFIIVMNVSCVSDMSTTLNYTSEN